MAILKIARMGHPVLLMKAEPVEDATAPEIKKLVADMIETMDDANGRGLAANQVHMPKRVVVFRPPPDLPEGEGEEEGEAEGEGEADSGDDDGEAEAADGEVLALVNPEIEVLGEEIAQGWEGCLSVPEMQGVVPRYTQVRYSGTTPDGERIMREVSGFHARVVQHEFDHLDGILYPMRMTDLGLLVFESEVHHLVAAAHAETGEPDPGEQGEL